MKKKSKLALWVAAAVTAAVFIGMTGFAVCIKIMYPVKYRAEIGRYAGEYGFEPYLILAVIKTESGFDTNAKSGAGAVGLMQLMPATARFIADKAEIFEGDIGEADLYDPDVNIRLGCAYLRYLMCRFGNLRLCLCAYNAGEGNVAAWLIDPRYSTDGKSLYKIPFKETEKYYKRVERGQRIYGYIL